MRTLDGAVLVEVRASRRRACSCPCASAGHAGVCQAVIPAGSVFGLALIERSLGGGEDVREQVAICGPCAGAVRRKEEARA